ncbi:pancreatic secretory granule membrane major glycoprotein GP2-like isoform X2 [Scyliorhinus canicula]|uniref:pancreatic secretory granule membrane major glycoprotein GP2-like isoform X2 n=1 Tax=Scyliorhinus canicula TaxID=7830 RepID=UPI0018F4A6C5|nr:pancreatic secretory granule membrane major glycoprotein GP2-like isoform X2 [Scyliorhinus canicula]
MNWDLPSEMKTLLLILGCLNCCHLLSANPCVNHTVLDQPWRSTKCANTDCSSLKCDEDLATGWYRFNGSGGSTIPDKLVPRNLCSTHAPGWLNGTHPIPDDGEVTRKVCFHWRENPCLWSVEIKIKQCSNYFVYYLVKTPFCSLAYCTGEAVVPTPPTKPETTLPPTPETTLPPTRDHSATHTRDHSATHARDHSATHARDHSATQARDHSATQARDHSATQARDHSATSCIINDCPKSDITIVRNGWQTVSTGDHIAGRL